MQNITKNRKAYHEYDVIETIVAGISLLGAEVKAIRAGNINITEAFARVDHSELFLCNLHIGAYKQMATHDPLDEFRKRKLLLHKRQIAHLSSEVDRKHLTIIPLSVFFEKQWVKLELGLCRVRKKYDKREQIQGAAEKKRLADIKRNFGKP